MARTRPRTHVEGQNGLAASEGAVGAGFPGIIAGDLEKFTVIETSTWRRSIDVYGRNHHDARERGTRLLAGEVSVEDQAWLVNQEQAFPDPQLETLDTKVKLG